MWPNWFDLVRSNLKIHNEIMQPHECSCRHTRQWLSTQSLQRMAWSHERMLEAENSAICRWAYGVKMCRAGRWSVTWPFQGMKHAKKPVLLCQTSKCWWAV